jgi:DNA mismatch repair protein MutL
MQALIEQIDKLKKPYTCPHGRPTMISLTLNELEQMFGRK